MRICLRFDIGQRPTQTGQPARNYQLRFSLSVTPFVTPNRFAYPFRQNILQGRRKSQMDYIATEKWSPERGLSDADSLLLRGGEVAKALSVSRALAYRW